MIFVAGLPFSTDSSSSSPPSSQRSDTLIALMEHPGLVSAAESFKSMEERKVSASQEGSSKCKYVYIFQGEYATVDPALVDYVGTDEATTCLGIVIRNRRNGLTSVAHMDSPKIVDAGISQMLSLLVDHGLDAELDVHLIGGFDDVSPNHANGSSVSIGYTNLDGYSFPLCTKIVDTLQRRQEKFHIQTLFVLGHNTKWDFQGNAYPIFHGFLFSITKLINDIIRAWWCEWEQLYRFSICKFLKHHTHSLDELVETSTGYISPASFDGTARCPDEIVRRIRVTSSWEDISWKGKLLETYETQTDQFVIAPCRWTALQSHVIMTLQHLSDKEILLTCSTSPSAEGPDFVENLKRQWNYLIKHPDWRETFPSKQPRIFKRTSDGDWIKC